MRPIVRNSADSSTPLSHSEAGRAFLQRRVAIFGLISGGLGGFFLVLRPLAALPHGVLQECCASSFLFHFLAVASLLAVWLACRGVQRSSRFIRVVETAGLIGAAAGYSAMGATMPEAARADYVVLLALALGLVARSIYVPSTARRTLLLCTGVAIPALVIDYRIFSSLDVETWSVVYPALSETDLSAFAATAIGFHAAWWFCVVFICTAASKVIYGLRREVRKGRKLGRYTLQAKIGEGGMGTVYRASHAMLRRPTAVKLIRAEKTGEQALTRFEREVQRTASLTHPNTVTVFDYGHTPDGVFYYAMELLDGPTLAEVVEAGGPQPPARVAHILDQAAGALAEAHDVGLIHRDIKPANIMIVEQGGEYDVAKVLDFGLVKEIDSGPVGISQDRTLIGTPLYMSPEAIKSPASVDARSDLYALGAIGYFLLTGEAPFAGDSVVEVCGRQLHTAPLPPSERLGEELPADLEDVILACLEKDPADRPQSARELRARLRACRVYGTWSRTEARAWWAHNCEPTIDYRPGRFEPIGIYEADTLAIDVASRSSAVKRTEAADRGSTISNSDSPITGAMGAPTWIERSC